MPIEVRDRFARVAGVLSMADVSVLVAWLRATEDPEIDLSGCTHLHTAGFQALIVFRPLIVAAPRDPFLGTHLFRGCPAVVAAGAEAGAGPDAGRDAGPDAGRDAGPDAGRDAGPDTGPDTGTAG
jgi:hypothetical protein